MRIAASGISLPTLGQSGDSSQTRASTQHAAGEPEMLHPNSRITLCDRTVAPMMRAREPATGKLSRTRYSSRARHNVTADLVYMMQRFKLLLLKAMRIKDPCIVLQNSSSDQYSIECHLKITAQ